MEIFRVTCHGENAWVPVGHTICKMTQRCYRQEDYRAAHLFETRQEANRGSPGAARSAPRTAARPLPPCPRVSGTRSPSLSSSLSSLPPCRTAGRMADTPPQPRAGFPHRAHARPLAGPARGKLRLCGGDVHLVPEGKRFPHK